MNDRDYVRELRVELRVLLSTVDRKQDAAYAAACDRIADIEFELRAGGGNQCR